MEVRVIRSRRRRKTVSARLVKGTLVVSAPAALPGERLKDFVADFRERFKRRLLRDGLNRGGGLAARARELGERYFPGMPPAASVEYVTGQERRFGCCDCGTRRIRVSHRVAGMPRWVRDYVLVHELAHLLVPRHDRAFWGLVARYPLAERARGFLLGSGMRGELSEPKSQTPDLNAREGERDWAAEGDRAVGAAGTP